MTKTILIVDNNAIDRALLRGFLEETYTVTEAESGAEMLSVLSRNGIMLSAIVLNLVLPDIDGLEALQKIRDNAIFRQVPIIVASAQNNEEMQARFFSLGATGFISVPYNKDIVLPVLENTIRLSEKSEILNDFNIGFLSRYEITSKQQPPEADVTAVRLKTLFENIHGGVSVVVFEDNNTVHLAYANDSYYMLFGYTKEQFAKELKDPHDAIHPEDWGSAFSTIDNIKDTKQGATFRYRIIKRDKSIAYIRCSSSVTSMVGVSGHVLISILTDITESVQIEKQAIVSVQRLDAIMKNMNSAVTAAVIKSNGTIEMLFSNDLFEQMLGYTKEQYQSEVSDPFKLVHPEDVNTIQDAVHGLHRIGDGKELQYRVFTRDGQIKWIRARISLMTFPDADEPVQLAVYADITDIAEAQRKLASQHEQIAELLNDTPTGIAIVEVDPKNVVATLRTTYYNDRFFSYSGYSRNEYDALLKNNELSFVFKEDIPALMRDIEKLCTGEIGLSADTTLRCHTKSGGYRWLLLTGQLSIRRGSICVINLAIVDVTERQEAIDRQRISDEMLRIAAETDQRSMIVYDIKNNTCRAESRTLFSARYGDIFENIPQSLIDMGLTAPDSEDTLCSLFTRIREGEKHIRVSMQMHSGPNKYEWFECNATTVFDTEGLPIYAVLVFHNITEQRIKEAVFKKWQQSIVSRPVESYTLFRCNLSRDATLDQQDGELLKISFPADALSFNSRTKLYAEEFVFHDDREEYIKLLDSDTLLAMFYRGDHVASLDYREITASKKESWRRLTIEMVEYPNSTDVQAFLMYEDIDKDKKAEIVALELAKTDPLTGVLNRGAFVEKVDEIICENPNLPCALIMLDMDGFKQINDTFGHAAGDQALQEVAAVLRSYSKNDDLVCRLGGDEFLVWLHDVPYNAVIGKTAQQMCEHIRKAYSQEVLLSASAGIAVYPRDGQSYDELYPNADKALYKVKQSGKGSYAFFSAIKEELTTEITQALSDVKQVHATAHSKKRRMLIVDDNETSRMLLNNIFKDDYLIEMAKNGAEAMIRLRHFGASISVVLLDLLMPDVDGFAVLKKMQNDIDFRTIPVVIVTEDKNHETLLKAFELGAAEYVTKPVDVDIIKMRVQAVISKAENERLRAQNSYLTLQRDEEAKYRTVLESTGTVVIEYDWRNHVYIYDSEISKHIAGRFNHRGLWQIFLSDMVADSADVKAMQDMLIILAGARESSHDSKLVKLKTPNGLKHWFRMNIYKRVDDFGLAEKLIITFNDVHDEVLANEKLLFQATRDELTGLYNRTGFLEKAAELITAKEPGYYVMACIDVEKFQIINDRYGTEKGDEILRHIADSVSDFVEHNGGICCRYTADRFAVLYPARLLGSVELAENHRLAGMPDCIPQPLRLRIGRCMVNEKSLPASAIFDRAAMAEAFVKGRYDTYIIDYDESMRDTILKEQQIVGDMVDALKNREFEPWFQPQYNHATGALIGAEALVRWHKDGMIIPPCDFIPVFEKNGFIYEVDQSIWRQVCAMLRRWLDEGKNPLPISVNISRFDMFQDNFIDVITGLVSEYQLPVDLLRLEITESAFSADTATITDIAGRLIDAGFTVEIDDFGSGYSSLNTLKDVPASILKLDMRFFERTGNANRGGNIVESVVRMAKWLGMVVIAEGVEDNAQADYLKSIGCYYIQGYLYAKPMPAEEYEKRLDSGITEVQLAHLQTFQHLDNNNFWDSHSMDTLIFNSYVGAACILEFHEGKVEMLRATDHFVRMLGGAAISINDVLAINWMVHMDNHNMKLFSDAVSKSLNTKENVIQEFEFHGLPKCSETIILRSSLRVIATVGERHLIYCLSDNMTAQRAAERAALNASERVNAVMDNSHCGISAAIPRADGTVELIFVNNRFFELLGYTKEQYEEEVKSPYDLVVPEDRDRIFETVTTLKEIGSTVSVEMREIRRDGSIIWIRCDASMIKFANIPEPVQLTSYLDITVQKENELKQLESSHRLEAIMANINGGISAVYLKDDKIKYVVANEHYYKILGFTKEEFESDAPNPFDLLHPDDREWVRKKFIDGQKNDGRYTMEYRMIRRDGASRNILCNTSVVHLHGIDEPVQLAVTNDITELREMQLNEIAAKDRLNTVMNSISNGITALVFHDNGMEFLFANNRFYEIYGICRGDIGVNHLSDALDLILPKHRETVRNAIHEALNTAKTVCTEYQIQRPDGAVRWVRVTINMTKLVGVSDPVQVAVLSDITDEKVATDHLRFLNNTAHDILTQSDSGQAIKDTLANLVTYLSAERGYIIELDDSHMMLNNTYEFCSDGIEPLMEYWQAISYTKSDYWYESLSRNKFFAIEDVRSLDDSQSYLREMLLSQNIHSIILAPLWRDGRLIAFTGVDNPSHTFHQLEQLKVLTDYCTVLLTRRDLMRKIQYDNETVRHLMDDTPGGFLRMQILPDNTPVIVSLNAGFCEMLGMTSDEVMAEYGDDAYRCVVDEDTTAVKNAAVEALAGNGVYTYKCRLKKKDGTALWIQVFGRFVKSENGELFRNSYFTDITEQKTTEEMQIDLLDNLPFGTAMYDYDGKNLTAIHINKSYWKLVKRSSIGTVIGALHPDDRIVIQNEIEASIRQNRNPEANCRILCGDGSYQPFHVIGTITSKENGHWTLCLAYEIIDKNKMSIQEMLPIALSTMVSHSEDMSYVKDKDLRYISVSPSIAKMAKVESPRDLIGKTAVEVFRGKFAEKFDSDDLHVIKTGETIKHALEHVQVADGSFRLMRTSKYPIMNASGQAIGVFSVSQDITNQREKESQLELLTNSIPGGIATFRCTCGNIETIYFNDGVCELAGYSRDEYDAHPIPMLDLIYDEDIPIIRKQIELLHGGEKSLSFTVRIHTKNSGYKWINSVATVTNNLNEVYLVNAVLTDVTEQQLEKERLRLAEEEYRIATEHSARTICRYNIADMSLKISHEAANRLALPSVIQGVPYEQSKNGSVSPDTVENYIAFFESIIQGEKICECVFCKKLNNRWRWLSGRSTSIFDLSGKPLSAIISFTDITEAQEKELIYKKWEQSLTERNSKQFTLYRCNLNKDSSYDTKEGSLFGFTVDNDVEKLFNECTAEFCDQYVVADDRRKYIKFLDSDRMLADYYRGVHSDELVFRAKLGRDDIRWIHLSLELLEYPGSTDIEAYLMYEDINDSVLEEQQIKKMAETDSLTGLQNRKIFIERVDSLIAENRNYFHSALFLLDIDCFKHINDTFGHAVGDESIISVADVILSVIKEDGVVCRLGGDEFLVYLPDMPSHESISDKARELCEAAHITIKNDIQLSVSIGVAPVTDGADNFDSMYNKADKALYYVKGHGKNNFAFYETVMEKDDNEVISDAISGSLTTLASGKNTVLIVDDSAINRVVIAGYFKKEFKTVEAENGQLALDYLLKYSDEVAIVLLDIMMPVMDGYQLMEAMKSDTILQEIPIIVISGEDDRKASLKAIKAGASDYVVKPVDPELLHLRVSSALSKAENVRLHKQNNEFAVDSQELNSYRSLMDSNLTVLIEYNAKTGVFKYAPKSDVYLSGKYDERPIWQIFADDKIASDADVEAIRKLITESEKPCKATFNLMTPDKTVHPFLMKVILRNATENDDVTLITLTDRK